MNRTNWPVVVIGAGPVGLAAAAHLAERRLPFRVLERSARVAAAPRAFAHVRLFTPWRYAIDAAALRLLAAISWHAPDSDALPTGRELAESYLAPLAAHPAIAPHIACDATVEAVTREGLDKMGSADRAERPFAVRWRDAGGTQHTLLARAIIDASGTFGQPGPLGADGLAVDGETAAGDAIAYGLPDVAGAERAAYAGRRTLVVGSGHSAINVVLDLLRLADEAPETDIMWALRRGGPDRLSGGGTADGLPARGALGLAAQEAIAGGRVRLLSPFAATRLHRTETGVRVEGRLAAEPVTLDVARIVVATGFRPDLGLLRELRVALDEVVEAPPRLAPLIEPNLHSCGTVPPHGAAELAHPEPDLYIVGAKSYGRAPTFLMATGYEQVRSVVAALAGDATAAREVRLVLPPTGVCSAPPASACCGGPAPAPDACCVADAMAKARGAEGCGCASAA